MTKVENLLVLEGQIRAFRTVEGILTEAGADPAVVSQVRDLRMEAMCSFGSLAIEKMPKQANSQVGLGAGIISPARF